MGEELTGIIEIPLGFKGCIYRSPMPFSPYDKSNRVWTLYFQNNIHFVLVLAETQEMLIYTGRDLLDFYKSKGLGVRHFPIPDYHAPENREEFDRMINYVVRKAESGMNIAVHCLAGIGRTGLVLAIMAKTYLRLDGDEAISWIRDYIPGSIENTEQEQYIREYQGGDGI